MPDYSKGKIYKIIDINNTKCYIGSTTQSLNERMSNHKRKYKSYKNGNHHKVSIFDLFDEFGLENCKIELIEEYNCGNKTELERKEGEYIRNIECINKRIEGRTKEEYRDDNKEKIKEQRKEYYENNKEKDKQYRKNNKEKIKEQQKQYYENNKDKILEKQKQLVLCECGVYSTIHHISRHRKSEKHLKSQILKILKK